jgi:hypothetical protein
MKLGIKASTMYDSKPADEYHPEVSLPSALFKGKYGVGDKCKLTITGVIENMGKDMYRVKLLEGDEMDSGSSLLKKAK